MLTDLLPLTAEPAPFFAETPAEPVRFTYSHPGQSAFRRGLIRAVERISGQPKLERLYLDWVRSGKRPGESVFDAAMRQLRVTVRVHADEVEQERIRPEGGLLLVANHPFGVLDGLALGWLGMRLRGNVRILTNSLLCRVPEVDPHLLPVDFSGTPEARRLTAETRRKAAALLAEGKVVAVFPGGGVATANRPLTGHAVDSPWHPFVGRLATLPGVTTLPVHVAGQNSRLFQIASHTSYPLRVALIFHETRRRMGRPVDLTLGAPVTPGMLAQIPRDEVAAALRRRCMALAGPAIPDPDETFVWPSHVRW